MKVLEVKNICKKFNKTSVLNNFNLDVEEGEIVSIIGPSGIGKSTLLRCINGLEKIDSGEIWIEGRKIGNKIGKETNLQVGLVFQEYNLFPQYSVLKNVTLPLTVVLKMNKEEAILKAKELLDKMKLIKKIASYPFELSGGEKQRVAIARTLATNPKIICFDEPTSALDSKLIKQVISIIKELVQEKKSILIVTHDLKFANEISDRIIEFDKRE